MSMWRARSSANQSRACASDSLVEPSNGIRSSCQRPMIPARISISTGSG